MNEQAYPVLSIHILICIPFPGEKWPLPADDLSSKERGQGWVFLQERRNRDILFALVQPVCVVFSSLCQQVCQLKVFTPEQITG